MPARDTRLNPSCVAVTEYAPGGRSGNTELPLSFVADERLIPVFVSVMVPLALATAPPHESVTVPSKVAFTACPTTWAENSRRTIPSNRARLTRHSFGDPLPAEISELWPLLRDLLRAFTEDEDVPNSLSMMFPPLRNPRNRPEQNAADYGTGSRS